MVMLIKHYRPVTKKGAKLREVACHPVSMPLKHEWRLGGSLRRWFSERFLAALGYAPLRERNDKGTLAWSDGSTCRSPLEWASYLAGWFTVRRCCMNEMTLAHDIHKTYYHLVL
jgi:hypothetical protein